MSRTTLAALRKHRTPAEFAQRFLLPTLKRGRVPPLPRPKEPLTGSTKSSSFHGPIIFVNASEPRESIRFNIELLTGSAKKHPVLVLQNKQERGAKVAYRDWKEGKLFARVRPAGKFDELVIEEHHIHPEWSKVAERGPNDVKRYPIPAPLFRELSKYGNAGSATTAIINILRAASGLITPGLAMDINPFRIRRDDDPFRALIQSVPMSRSDVQAIVYGSQVSDIARVIERNYGVDKRYATMLAKSIRERTINPRFEKGMVQLLSYLQ